MRGYDPICERGGDATVKEMGMVKKVVGDEMFWRATGSEIDGVDDDDAWRQSCTSVAVVAWLRFC